MLETSNSVILNSWAKQMATRAAIAIAGQNQTVHWMASASLNILHTKLHLQHPITFVYYGTSDREFKININIGSSKFNITRNPQKGPSIQMWFRMLQSMLVKSFHYFCWSRHSIKQKNWTNFQA